MNRAILIFATGMIMVSFGLTMAISNYPNASEHVVLYLMYASGGALMLIGSFTMAKGIRLIIDDALHNHKCE